MTEVAPGRWRIRAFVGTDQDTGRPRQIERVVNARTKKAAQALLDELRSSAVAMPTTGSGASVRAVIEEYLRHLETRGRAPRTIHENRRILDTVIGPEIGDVPVGDLTARHLDELYRRLVTGESRARPAAPSSIRRYHAVISAALGQAVKWDWLDRNVAAKVTLPASSPTRLTVPTAGEVAALIRAAEELSPVWGLLVKLAVVTGARRGELCALRWSDVDVEAGVLHIRRSLYRVAGETGEKGTKSGRERVVVLDPATAWLLDDWLAWCQERARVADTDIVEGGFIASTWPDCSRPVNVDTFSSTVGRLCAPPDEKNPAGLGMPHVHLHSLRHFAATELLAGGVSPSDTAQLLGHADGGQLALRTYAHATDERQRQAAAILGRALGDPGRQ